MLVLSILFTIQVEPDHITDKDDKQQRKSMQWVTVYFFEKEICRMQWHNVIYLNIATEIWCGYRILSPYSYHYQGHLQNIRGAQLAAEVWWSSRKGEKREGKIIMTR